MDRTINYVVIKPTEAEVKRLETVRTLANLLRKYAEKVANDKQ